MKKRYSKRPNIEAQDFTKKGCYNSLMMSKFSMIQMKLGDQVLKSYNHPHQVLTVVYLQEIDWKALKILVLRLDVLFDDPPYNC